MNVLILDYSQSFVKVVSVELLLIYAKWQKL